MNSKSLIYLLLAGMAYAGFIVAHNKFDRRAHELPEAPAEKVDVTAQVGELMRVGIGGSLRVKKELESMSTDESFLALLPTTQDSWVARFRELEKTGSRPSENAEDASVAYPRGLQADKPRILQINRDGVGKAWLTVFEFKDGSPEKRVAAFEVKVNVPQSFPTDLTFEDGAAYRIAIAHNESEKPMATGRFEILKASEQAELQVKMTTLRQQISEAIPLLFMQVCVSMSLELHDNAASIINRLMKRNGTNDNLSTGVMERLVFLFDHRGGHVQANETLAKLKRSR